VAQPRSCVPGRTGWTDRAPFSHWVRRLTAENRLRHSTLSVGWTRAPFRVGYRAGRLVIPRSQASCASSTRRTPLLRRLRATLVPCSRSAMASHRATRDDESWSGIRENRGDALPGRADRRWRSCRAPRCGWAMRPDHAVRLPTSQTRCVMNQSEARRCRSCRHDRPGRSRWGNREARDRLNGVEPVQISRLVEWRHRGCC
jgi:hypothetical protein